MLCQRSEFATILVLLMDGELLGGLGLDLRAGSVLLLRPRAACTVLTLAMEPALMPFKYPEAV